mgnify:CR=1 FL=1
MRIVVKVGTSTLAYPTGRLNIRHAEELVKVLSDLKNEGHEVILVSSGAIGMGVGKLSLPARPKDTTTKQACAAVGQCELMYTYDRLFSAYDHTVAQILLTGVDVEHTERRVNIPEHPDPSAGTGCTAPSSMKTTVLPPMRSLPLATTTRWPLLWPAAARPTCWCC